jgi:hypothetical protein
MSWTRDRAGRCVKRPYDSTGELDHRSEQLITTFLVRRHHRVAFPVATADLIGLVEYLGGVLDLSADLSADERTLHGCTEFVPGYRPLVRIARWLSAPSRHEHHLRTTLMHACGHVWLHRLVLGARSRVGPLVGGGHRVAYHCRPATMLRAPRSNRAEWQAGYVSGALLMPVSALRAVIQRVLAREHPFQVPFPVHSPAGRLLVREVMTAFAMSEEAARVRLRQWGVLTEASVVQGQLFA